MGILRADRITGLGGANAIKGSAYLHGGDDSSGSQTMNMKDSSLAIGTNEFCCDFWMYWVDTPTQVRVVGNLNQGSYTNAQSWAYLRFADGTSRLWNGSSYVSTGADNFVANRWYHIAVIRTSGNQQALYIDGSMQSTTVSNTNDLTNDEFDINGRASDGAESARIFFSNVRLTIGSGASELGGIVPVGESEVLADTKILCCNSPGNILNESAQGIPITTGRNSTANASVGTASRFTPNSPVGFSTTTDVGSQYGATFDGFGNFATSTYMVPPGGNTRERNRGRGLITGGATGSPSTNVTLIKYFDIASGGITDDFGNLTAARRGIGSVASSTRACAGGGFVAPTSPAHTVLNTIDFVTIANTANATDFGDMQQTAYSYATSSNQTRGLFAGGYRPNNSAVVNTIDLITIATTGNASNFGDLTRQARSFNGAASTTRGVFFGGAPSTQDTIDFVTFSTTGDATDFGNLTVGRDIIAGSSSNTRGVIGGGRTPSNSNVIDYITIASAGNATDFGDLTAANYFYGASSNNTRVVWVSDASTNVMEFVTIATTGNASDFGDQNGTPQHLAGVTSDSHGGLS